MISPSPRLNLLPRSLLALTTLTRGANAQTDNSSLCSCFKTNGSSSAYYTYHRFHDFRNINSSLASNPNVLTDPNSTTNADVTSGYFDADAWMADWEIQNWNNSDVMGDDNATVFMINSANNVYVGPLLSLLHALCFSRAFTESKQKIHPTPPAPILRTSPSAPPGPRRSSPPPNSIPKSRTSTISLPASSRVSSALQAAVRACSPIYRQTPFKKRISKS
jgi:hypothetical protein